MTPDEKRLMHISPGLLRRSHRQMCHWTVGILEARVDRVSESAEPGQLLSESDRLWSLRWRKLRFRPRPKGVRWTLKPGWNSLRLHTPWAEGRWPARRRLFCWILS